jgi:UDP-glucose 4-epimerase
LSRFIRAGAASRIRKVIPEARLQLPEGFDPKGPGRVFELEVNRIRAETGFVPEYGVETGVADYIAWLCGGNRD